MKFGLSDQQLGEIQEVLRKFPAVTEGVLFGSRAMGNYKEASDVDLALKGGVSHAMARDVKEELEETDLPFFFDVIAYPAITEEKLREHIDKYGVAIYRAGWREYKLGELCRDISYGYTESASSEPVGPKFLRITDIVPGRVNWATVPYCKISDEDHAKYRLQEGDIVIARTGATTGYTYTIKPTDLKHDAVFASYLIRYRIDDKKADPFFIGHLLTSKVWKGFVEGILGGSAQPGANAKRFADFDILLPPLPEQRAIAAVLSSLDDKIDLLHRQSEILEDLASATFRHFFVDNRKTVWESCLVISLADHDKTTIRPGKNPETTFLHYSIPAFDESHMPKSELGASIQSNKYKVRGNSILFSKLNPHRDKRIWLIPESISENSICSTEFQVVMPKEKKLRNFLYGFLNHYENYDEIAAGVGGTSGSHQRIAPEVVFKFRCFLPDDVTLTKYNEVVDGLVKKTHDNRQATQSLVSLRDLLLPKLMTGEVKIQP